MWPLLTPAASIQLLSWVCRLIGQRLGNRSPQVRALAVAAPWPHLHPRSLMASGFAVSCQLAQPRAPQMRFVSPGTRGPGSLQSQLCLRLPPACPGGSGRGPRLTATPPDPCAQDGFAFGYGWCHLRREGFSPSKSAPMLGAQEQPRPSEPRFFIKPGRCRFAFFGLIQARPSSEELSGPRRANNRGIGGSPACGLGRRVSF